MYYLYVLVSKKDSSVIIGCTGNVEEKLKAHNAGKVAHTKNKRPLEFLYKEEAPNKQEAFKLERFYNTPRGRSVLKKKIDAQAKS